MRKCSYNKRNIS